MRKKKGKKDSINIKDDFKEVQNKILIVNKCHRDTSIKRKLYGIKNSISVQIPFPQPRAEPSDNSASLSSSNGNKAIPVN